VVGVARGAVACGLASAAVRVPADGTVLAGVIGGRAEATVFVVVIARAVAGDGLVVTVLVGTVALALTGGAVAPRSAPLTIATLAPRKRIAPIKRRPIRQNIVVALPVTLVSSVAVHRHARTRLRVCKVVVLRFHGTPCEAAKQSSVARIRKESQRPARTRPTIRDTSPMVPGFGRWYGVSVAATPTFGVAVASDGW